MLIYSEQEGVMVAERNTKLPKHPELETIPNLQVCFFAVKQSKPGLMKVFFFCLLQSVFRNREQIL